MEKHTGVPGETYTLEETLSSIEAIISGREVNSAGSGAVTGTNSKTGAGKPSDSSPATQSENKSDTTSTDTTTEDSGKDKKQDNGDSAEEVNNDTKK